MIRAIRPLLPRATFNLQVDRDRAQNNAFRELFEEEKRTVMPFAKPASATAIRSDALVPADNLIAAHESAFPFIQSNQYDNSPLRQLQQLCKI
jgi:hypothetical protein